MFPVLTLRSKSTAAARSDCKAWGLNRSAASRVTIRWATSSASKNWRMSDSVISETHAPRF